MAKKGIALLLTMSVVFVVLTTVVIVAAVILNNLERSREQASAGQAETAIAAASERIRGLYKQNNHFFEGCSVDDCVNFDDPENVSCVNCSDAKSIYANENFRYRARIAAAYVNGRSFAITGYAGQAVFEQNVPILFFP